MYVIIFINFFSIVHLQETVTSVIYLIYKRLSHACPIVTYVDEMYMNNSWINCYKIIKFWTLSMIQDFIQNGCLTNVQ